MDSNNRKISLCSSLGYAIVLSIFIFILKLTTLPIIKTWNPQNVHDALTLDHTRDMLEDELVLDVVIY